jgi:hypothetical protein
MNFFLIDVHEERRFNPALNPCVKEKCPRWREWEGRGRCILLIKGGKFSFQDIKRHNKN